MTGRKEWAADDVLSAADLEGYLMDQVVGIWANSSARASGYLAPIEGNLSYLQDTDLYYRWNGSAWAELTVTNATNATNATYATTAGTAVSANKISNRSIFVQSSTPTALATDDLWFY